MLKLKSQLKCSYCSKIVKDPIELPCNDSICLEHLSDRDVVKENKIKCGECNEEFQIKDIEFKSRKTYKKLKESQSYLSVEETSLKHELEESLKKFFEFYDEFAQNKAQLESDVYNHFEEMRFQVDEQREELKKKIDDIALAMIDKIKKNEEIYLKELKVKFSSVHESQSLEIKLNEIQELFRNPSLLIETIKEMQQKQEESLRDIQLKLNEMNQIKDDLKATLFFIPNLSSFNQDETSMFGSIKLNQYSNIHSLQSEILKDERLLVELIKLCEFSPNDKWSLLYRGTRDGFGAKDFHSKCDGHSNTLTIIKAKESEFIFGGFTAVHWESSTNRKWKSDPNAFIFSLTNKDSKPLKMKIDPNEHKHAIGCHSIYGPTFGDDIRIANNANTTMDNYSNLGDCYKHPQYACGTIKSLRFLAGLHTFQLGEIEVYQKE
jgi:hypothetical protein